MAQRRFGTVLRDNAVHEMYEQELKSLGMMACYVSKGYIYKCISEKTGLSTRTTLLKVLNALNFILLFT